MHDIETKEPYGGRIYAENFSIAFPFINLVLLAGFEPTSIRFRDGRISHSAIEA